MSTFLDSVLADTVGVGWRAVTGTVDPWTKQQIIDDTNAGIAQASGPNATPEEIAANQAGTNLLITHVLQTTPDGSSDPADAGVHIPGLGNVGSGEFLTKVNTIVHGAIVVGVIAIGFWVWNNGGRTLLREFRGK